MATRAIRLDRMQAGLVAWVSSVLPSTTVVWGKQSLPRESAAASLATFSVIAGPRSAGQGGGSMRPWTLITTATITVPAVAEGDYLTIRASGTSATHQVTAGEDGDTEAARDSLLAELQASSITATFAAASTNQITISASPGDIYDLIGQGVSVVTTASAPYAVQVDEAVYRVELQISSTDPSPMNGASSLMAELCASTDLPVPEAIRELCGLRVDMGNPINLSRLSGPDWQSREVVDIEVTLISLATSQAQALVQILANIEVRNDLATLETIEVSQTES